MIRGAVEPAMRGNRIYSALEGSVGLQRALPFHQLSTTGRNLENRLRLVWRRLRADPALTEEIIAILDDANDMTIATVREDGYPQATTVSYVNDGLNIYFGCAAQSQKAKNLAGNSKVSLAVNLPYASWKEDSRSVDRRQGGAYCRPTRGGPGVPPNVGARLRSRLSQRLWPHRSGQSRQLKIQRASEVPPSGHGSPHRALAHSVAK